MSLSSYGFIPFIFIQLDTLWLKVKHFAVVESTIYKKKTTLAPCKIATFFVQLQQPKGVRNHVINVAASPYDRACVTITRAQWKALVPP